MLRQFSTKRVIGFFALDWLGTLAILSIAAVLRAEVGPLTPQLNAFLEALDIQTYLFWSNINPSELIPWQVYLMVTIIWPFFFITFSVYDGRRNPTILAECTAVFLSVSISTLTLSGALYFSYRETPRVLILIFFVLDSILLIGARLFWGLFKFGTKQVRKNQKRPVMVIGAGIVGRNVARNLNKYAHAGIEIVGFLDDDPIKIGGQVEGLPVLGTLDKARQVVSTFQVQDAVIALPLRAHKRLVEICNILQELSIHVHVIPDLFALSFPNATLDGFGGIPVIDLGQPGIRGFQRGIKRAFDLVGVTVGIIFLSPLFLLIGILIKLDSKGPVFYKQERIGEFGRTFNMLKFRSMRADADPSIHKAHISRLIRQNITPDQLGDDYKSLKLENDPRITRLGRFLRKSSLDELPQLINVLRADMSLVGPRPPMLYEVDLYQDWHMRRFEVLPGITGIWQVKGRNRVSFDEMVRMDLEYIEKQSLWLDIKLLLQTPRAVLGAKGAG